MNSDKNEVTVDFLLKKQTEIIWFQIGNFMAKNNVLKMKNDRKNILAISNRFNENGETTRVQTNLDNLKFNKNLDFVYNTNVQQSLRASILNTNFDYNYNATTYDFNDEFTLKNDNCPVTTLKTFPPMSCEDGFNYFTNTVDSSLLVFQLIKTKMPADTNQAKKMSYFLHDYLNNWTKMGTRLNRQDVEIEMNLSITYLLNKEMSVDKQLDLFRQFSEFILKEYDLSVLLNIRLFSFVFFFAMARQALKTINKNWLIFNLPPNVLNQFFVQKIEFLDNQNSTIPFLKTSTLVTGGMMNYYKKIYSLEDFANILDKQVSIIDIPIKIDVYNLFYKKTDTVVATTPSYFTKTITIALNVFFEYVFQRIGIFTDTFIPEQVLKWFDIFGIIYVANNYITPYFTNSTGSIQNYTHFLVGMQSYLFPDLNTKLYSGYKYRLARDLATTAFSNDLKTKNNPTIMGEAARKILKMLGSFLPFAILVLTKIMGYSIMSTLDEIFETIWGWIKSGTQKIFDILYYFFEKTCQMISSVMPAIKFTAIFFPLIIIVTQIFHVPIASEYITQFLNNIGLYQMNYFKYIGESISQSFWHYYNKVALLGGAEKVVPHINTILLQLCDEDEQLSSLEMQLLETVQKNSQNSKKNGIKEIKELQKLSDNISIIQYDRNLWRSRVQLLNHFITTI